MDAVAVVLAIILIILVFRLSRKLKVVEKDLAKTEDKLSVLDLKLSDLRKDKLPDFSQAVEVIPKPRDEASPSAGRSTSSLFAVETAAEAGPGTGDSAGRAEAVVADVTAAPATPSEVLQTGFDLGVAGERPALARRIERQVAENWTGIAGTAILVLGVAFLGVFTALRLSPLFRFVMVVACAVILGAGYVVLRKRAKWLRLALWLRSASGAVFLFACLGGGSIPGLRWINHAGQARVVLAAGVLINLVLAVAGGRQVFASLHVLLSLLAIGVSPQNMTTLIVAAVVAAFGVALTFRERWDLHLLATLTAFFAYHVFWYQSVGGKDALLRGQNIAAASAVALVCALAAFTHYRKIYGKKQFETVPFLVHLLNWTYFGAGILMHSSGGKWDTFPLVAGAVAAFGLAGHARKLQIRWLHGLDSLVAEILAVFAVASLARWGVEAEVILAVVFLEILAFTKVAMMVKDAILYRVGIAGSQLAAVLTLTVLATGDLAGTAMGVRACVLASLCALGALTLHRSIARSGERHLVLRDSLASLRLSERLEFSMTGVLTGAFLLAGGIFARDIPWLFAAVVAGGCGLLLVRTKIATNGLAIGSLVVAAGLHAVTWHRLLAGSELTAGAVLARALPLYALSALAIAKPYVASFDAHATWAGVWLAVSHTAVLCYALSEPVSPLVPGVSWLLLSLIALESARWLGLREAGGRSWPGRPDRSLLQSGYALLGLFTVRHVLVHLQSEEYLGFFKIRLAIEVLALAIILFWAFAKAPASQSLWASWRFLHPLFLELFIVFGVMTISVETAKSWHPLLWITLAALTVAIGVRAAPSLSRLKAYSFLFFWASVFQATFLLGVYEKLGMRWIEKSWILGSAAFAAQLVFLIVVVGTVSLGGVQFPPALRRLGPVCDRLAAGRNAALFYPWLIGAALFLSWTFSKSLLTLLWTLECFAVFVASLVLKEKHFRYSALAGLGICVARLVLIDLARATTLTKALVFLGVGILLLGIHALYNKYKGRFFNEMA